MGWEMAGGDPMRYKGYMQDLPQWTKDVGQWGDFKWKAPCHPPMAEAGALTTEGLGVSGGGDGMQWGNPRVETAWVQMAVMRRGWGGWVWHGIGPSGWLRKRWTT